MSKEKYKLILYVAGQTERSRRAIANLYQYCREHLEDSCSVEIVDLREHPHLAEGEQIVALPTLIKKLPEPIRVLIGDLSDKEQFLVGMNLIQG